MQAKPTILQIIPRLDTGGAELSTLEITQAVVRAGGGMLVLSEGGRLTDEIARAGGEWMAFPAATKNPAGMLLNSRRIAARHDAIIQGLDAVIANSQFTAELIRARHPISRDRLYVIHRGVDLARFDPVAIEPQRLEALRTAWGVQAGQRVILHAARLTGWKGQRVLIDAMARLRREGRLADAVAILAGDAQGRDGYVEELQTRIDQAGLADRVRLVGHCADIAAAYSLAHVTAVPSTEPEAFGRAAAEALAMGCPIVVSDHGAPPEILRTGVVAPSNLPRLGWLAPPGDADALAARLADALALLPESRDALRDPARAHVTRHFTVAHMQRATLAVYDRLLGSRFVAGFDAA